MHQGSQSSDVIGHCPGHGSRPLLSQAYPEMFCKAVAQVMYRTRHPQVKSKENGKTKEDNTMRLAAKTLLKAEIMLPDKSGTLPTGTATGYITDTGRRKRYRLLTLVGSNISESHLSFGLIDEKARRKEPDIAKGRIDAHSARLRAEMLAEHIMTGEGVIRVTNFEGVNIQVALEGDEGLTNMETPMRH